MDKLFAPRTIVDMLAQKKDIPWEQAERVLELPKPYNQESVSDFIVLAIKEILSDHQVRADIEKRVKSGSGYACNSHPCGGSECSHHAPKSILDGLIQESLDEISVDTGIVVIRKASKTYQNVLERGRAAGDSKMDSATDAFVRRKIFSETISRESIAIIQSKFKSIFSKNSKDGFLFALSGESLTFIPPDSMRDLMMVGHCVISLTESSIASSLVPALAELKRLSSLMVFDPVENRSEKVYWLNRSEPGPEKSKLSHVLKICEFMSRIPFELNQKNKQLMLQIIQYFQLVELKDTGIGFHLDSGRKITIIVPIAEDGNEPWIRFRDGSEVTDRNAIVLIDSNKCEYECPVSYKPRYHITGYLTGPIT